MSLPDQRNLRHLLAIVQGTTAPDPSLSWAKSTDDALSAWRLGFPGSVNRARYSNAIRASLDPVVAAKWWTRMIVVESGYDPSRTLTACHNGAEPMSGIYWGWSLVSEIAALRLLARASRRYPTVQPAIDALQVSIDRHVALASLTAAADIDVTIRGRKLLYRGPVSLGPGTRSHPVSDRDIHSVFAACLGITPHTPQTGVVADLARELSTEARRSPHVIHLCRGIIGAAPAGNTQTPPLRAAVAALVDGPLGNCRLAAPFDFYLWNDGRRLAVMRRNCNGNSGAVYATHLLPGAVDDSSVTYLYPYGGRMRVRSKSLIGAGSCHWVAGWDAPRPALIAENLTVDEERRKAAAGQRPRRHVDGWQVQAPAPDIVVHVGPDGASWREGG